MPQCVALHPVVQLKPLHKPKSSGQAATHLQVWYGLWLRLAATHCCRGCCQLASELLLQLCMVPHQVAKAKQCLHKLRHTTHPNSTNGTAVSRTTHGDIYTKPAAALDARHNTVTGVS